MDLNKIKNYVELGYIKVTKHPTEPLFIYNYSQQTQFEGHWNETTLLCRGLILDAEHNVKARPLAKFFNYEELTPEQIPNLPFEVFDKMDGSLGIMYWVSNKPYIATRGSFDSVQSQKANALLYSKYLKCHNHLNKTKTYLFEIIYPENRIVIDYGVSETLTLLAVIDTLTGQEEQVLPDIGFPVVQRYAGHNSLTALRALQYDNKEGFVIKFTNSFRLKIKFAEYVRLHSLITHCSSITVWEGLKNNEPIEALLQFVPDEFFTWVNKMRQLLLQNYQEVEAQCLSDFKILPTRKETAAYFMTCQYPSILFMMLDNKPYSHEIWKRTRPEYQKANPFSEDL